MSGSKAQSQYKTRASYFTSLYTRANKLLSGKDPQTQLFLDLCIGQKARLYNTTEKLLRGFIKYLVAIKH